MTTGAPAPRCLKSLYYVKSAQKQQIRADFAPRQRKLACAPEV
jgi:hypothetical protein